MSVEGTKRARRAKTFTGCWTCRSRKVKCDLGKPSCRRCERSGFECGGYDIKLRWSPPIKFNKYGVQLPANPSSSAKTEEPQFQRRNIAFVRYKDEYEYYEEMDDELSALHSPSLSKIANGQTWMIKKFGVFRGTDRVKKKYVPRKKRRQNGNQHKSPKPSKHESKKSEDNIAPNLSTISLDAKDSFETTKIANLFDFDFSSINFHGNEWISNELRDDALLSASAIQGVAMNSFSFQHDESRNRNSSSRKDEISGTLESPASANLEQSNNQHQDFGVSQIYKLLFHRSEDKTNTKGNSPKFVDLSNAKPSVVPLNNVILMDAPGPDVHMPRSVLEVVPSALPDSSIFGTNEDSDILLRIPTTGLRVHGLARFLLNYYLQNVVDLMTVVALPTNPWRTIYFPRALQALGDLAGIGYTSNSRNSLLNAILAVSCFNLQSKFPRNSPAMKYYLQLGIEFRSQASSFLKLCLETSVNQERYKDILTAILSMNSIDVVWGTMADCQYHLTLCEEIVEKRMKSRPKISDKARSLHRIFSFLKLIQDSTALDRVKDKEIVIKDDEDAGDPEEIEHGTDGEFKEALDETDGKIRIEFVKQNTSNASTPIFTNIASETYYYPKTATTSSDFLSIDALYGLPNSMILLFSDCVRLVRHRMYYRTNKLNVPQKFRKLCAEFERRLLNWKSEWDFYKPYSKEFLNDTVEGVYHHTMSFYYSLILYYFTMARDLNNRLLQSYVEKVLNHLTTLTGLIEDKNVKIVPLIWQGFIAGCASVDQSLQLQFKNWAAKLANSGMGSYWGARQIMFEVWRRRLNGEEHDNWFDVYKDWEMNLMLS